MDRCEQISSIAKVIMHPPLEEGAIIKKGEMIKEAGMMGSG